MKITATHETSLIELLQEAFPDASTNKLKKVIRCGCVRHNNAVVKHPELVLKRGETIEYTKYEAKRTYRERTSAPILYEDGTVVASFKPSGVPLTGKNVGGLRSLNNTLNADLTRLNRQSIAVTPVMYLRTDENGICLFCKRNELRDALRQACAKAVKHYRVWVCGTFDQEKGTLRAWAELNQRGFLRQWHENGAEGLEECIMKYTVISTTEEITLLDVTMVQHFENQLCMQLMQSGHPVLGDKANTHYRVDYPYPYTYNYKLEIPHPANGKTLTLATTLPSLFNDQKTNKNAPKNHQNTTETDEFSTLNG